MTRTRPASAGAGGAAYVDPRVVDRYHEGVTVADALDLLGDGDGPATHGAVEAAVLAMLRED